MCLAPVCQKVPKSQFSKHRTALNFVAVHSILKVERMPEARILSASEPPELRGLSTSASLGSYICGQVYTWQLTHVLLFLWAGCGKWAPGGLGLGGISSATWSPDGGNGQGSPNVEPEDSPAHRGFECHWASCGVCGQVPLVQRQFQ